ncbi:MAG: DNA repair protein RecO [Chitinophagales bacterium]|nr:DNA repair protein RecO [Chitinophagales bacterium]
MQRFFYFRAFTYTMLLHKTEGLVLKTIKYSDTSVITKVFTREFGLYSFIVRGVRGKGNKSKSNIFQALQLLELDIYYHPDKNLLKLKEYRPAYIYQTIYTDMLRQSIAIFFLEVLSKCVQEHEVNTELYDFIRKHLVKLDTNLHFSPLLPQIFLFELSEKLGIKPSSLQDEESICFFNLETATFEPEKSFHQVSLDSKESQLLSRFIQMHEDNYTKGERLTLLHILIAYFKIHIAGFKQLNSLEIIRQVIA